jgi:hypothetical protein
MTQFKVGDRVKTTKTAYCEKVGTPGTVAGFREGDLIVVDFDDGRKDKWFYDNALDLLESADPLTSLEAARQMDLPTALAELGASVYASTRLRPYPR